jgi:hypothetical protein
MDQFKSEMLFGYNITEWTFMIHTNLSNSYEMIPFELDPCGYAYQSYSDILKAILPQIQPNDITDWLRGNLQIDKYVEIAHAAWCANYIIWKNKHFTKASKDHSKSINTHERNDRATTHFQLLNNDDLRLYHDIIHEVFDILSKKILETGMQSLCM